MKRIVVTDGAPGEGRKEPSSTESASQEIARRSQAEERLYVEGRGTKSGRISQLLPPEIMAIFVPSFKVGAGLGATGMFAGAAAGIVRSAPPILYSLVAGAQWFTLGFSYYGSRLIAFKGMGVDTGPLTSNQKIQASALAGGIAGVCGGLLRGPRNILPAFAVMSVFGAGGQVVANVVQCRETKETNEHKGFWHSRWSPITPLSDQEYKHTIEEKLLRVEADIALIDDQIKTLRDAEKKQESAERDGCSQAESTASR